jgi:amidophosphoribosyltransferase
MERILSHEREPILDHCGIVAVHSTCNIKAFELGLAGLERLQTRGYDGAGFAALTSEGKTFQHKGEGTVREVFVPSEVGKFSESEGRTFIFQVRYGTTGDFSPENTQPFVSTHLYDGSPFILAHNGQFSDIAGYSGEKSDTQLFVEELAKNPEVDWDSRIIKAIQDTRGAWSFAIATESTLYVGRDPWGIRPLSYGIDTTIHNQTILVASETAALEEMGVDYPTEVIPGQIIKFKDGMSINLFQEGAGASHCIFENVYIGNGETRVHTYRRSNPVEIRNSPTIDAARRRCGEILAREAPLSQNDVDMVIGIPGTGIPGGQAYAKSLNIPYLQAIKDKLSTEEEKRTFMTAEIGEILQKVLNHFDFDKESLRGKSVVLVDDSIVRGNISQGLCKTLRKLGVSQIHFRVLSPPIDKTCHFGVNTRSENELIAARLHDNVKNIREEIGADSLAYLSSKGLCEAVTGEASSDGFCMGCMQGHVHPLDHFGLPIKNT